MQCHAVHLLSEIGISLQIADYFRSGTGSVRSEEFAVGLHNEFQPIQGHDIGQFPGLGTEKQADIERSLQIAT